MGWKTQAYFKVGTHYLWESEGEWEMLCVGFTAQGNAVLVYTENYGVERANVITDDTMNEYNFTEK